MICFPSGHRRPRDCLGVRGGGASGGAGGSGYRRRQASAQRQVSLGSGCHTVYLTNFGSPKMNPTLYAEIVSQIHKVEMSRCLIVSCRKVGLASSGASRFFPRATVDAVELSPAGLEVSAMGYVSDSASDTRVRRRHTVSTGTRDELQSLAQRLDPSPQMQSMQYK